MIVTLHAKRRYVQRIRPGSDMREASIVLADAAQRATHRGERTRRGDLVWTVDNPEMILITKHDPVSGPVVVTVLAPEEWISWVELDAEEARLRPAQPKSRPAQTSTERHRAALAQAAVARKLATKAERAAAEAARVEESRKRKDALANLRRLAHAFNYVCAQIEKRERARVAVRRVNDSRNVTKALRRFAHAVFLAAQHNMKRERLLARSLEAEAA